MTVRQSVYLAILQHFGTQASFARAIAASQPSVSNWCSGKYEMSPKYARRTERATQGRWKAEALSSQLDDGLQDALDAELGEALHEELQPAV